jgi:hypothetical protein
MLYQTNDGNSIFLTHAVSDDGVTWHKGTIASQSGSAGVITQYRAAFGSDHAGAVAWTQGNTKAIEFTRIGPEVPGAKPPGRLTITGSARPKGSSVRVSIRLTLVPPAGVSRAAACTGSVSVSVKRAKKSLVTLRGKLAPTCKATLHATLKRSAVGRAHSLALTTKFRGNTVLAASVRPGKVEVSRS